MREEVTQATRRVREFNVDYFASPGTGRARGFARKKLGACLMNGPGATVYTLSFLVMPSRGFLFAAGAGLVRAWRAMQRKKLKFGFLSADVGAVGEFAAGNRPTSWNGVGSISFTFGSYLRSAPAGWWEESKLGWVARVLVWMANCITQIGKPGRGECPDGWVKRGVARSVHSSGNPTVGKA